MIVVALLAVASASLGIETALAAAPVKGGSAPPGYVTIPVKEGGFTIAVPKSWLALDPESPTAAAVLQAAVDKNPNLAPLLDQFTTLRSSIKFWVIDTSSPTFSANLLVLPTGLDKSVVRQPAMVEAALRQSLGSNVTSLSAHKVKIAGVNAIEADADLTITDARGQPLNAYATILLVPTKQGLMDLDYTSGTPRESDKTLRTMRDSLRLT